MASQLDALIMELMDDPSAADRLIATISGDVQRETLTQQLRHASHEIQQRWLQSGVPIVTDSTGKSRDVTGDAYFDTINIVGGQAVLEPTNPRQLNVTLGGGGTDCMFDYLVSSCFATLAGFTEGKVFTSLSGCTFKGYSTVQRAVNDIALQANGSEWTVALCGMTTENVSIPAMISGPDVIHFMGAGAGIGNPGISGIKGALGVAAPVISIVQDAPRIVARDIWIGGALTGTTALVTHGFNQDSEWQGCSFFSGGGNSVDVGFDIGDCLAVTIRNCRFTGGTSVNAIVCSGGSNSPDGVQIVNNYFSGGKSILLTNTQPCNDLIIDSNHFDGGNNRIVVARFNGLTITGNLWQSNSSTTAITLGGGGASQDATITGNEFGGGNATTAPIVFAVNNQLRDVSISGNNFNFNGNGVPFIQSNNTDCQFIAVVGNVFGRTGNNYDITQVIGASGTFKNSVFGPNAPGQRVQYVVTGTENEFYPGGAGPTGGGGGPFPGPAASSEPFVTIGNTAGLAAERALTAGTGISIVDGGANGLVTISATAVTPVMTVKQFVIPLGSTPVGVTV